MMGQQKGGQGRLFYAFNLEDQIPSDHLLRGIDTCLDLSGLRQHLVEHYSHTGRPSVEMMPEGGHTVLTSAAVVQG